MSIAEPPAVATTGHGPGGGAGAGEAGPDGTTSGQPPLGRIGQFLVELLDDLADMTRTLHEEGVPADAAARIEAAWAELRAEARERAATLAETTVTDDALAGVGLDGAQLDAKLAAFAGAREQRARRRGLVATFDSLRGGARLVRRIGAKILGSLLSVLGEDPRWKAVLEAVKEFIELLDQAADEAELRQHHAGPADEAYLGMLGYPAG